MDDKTAAWRKAVQDDNAAPCGAWVVNRLDVVPYPDRSDVARAGLPSRWGRLKPSSKAATRRRQKRRARRERPEEQ